MARTRSENYDGIHLGILTNAARLFSAQGYMRASIADLADACKLSRGALYHYFDSKEAILFAILDAHIREMIQHVETAVAAGGPTLTQFQNVIRAIVEVNAKSPHEGGRIVPARVRAGWGCDIGRRAPAREGLARARNWVLPDDRGQRCPIQFGSRAAYSECRIFGSEQILVSQTLRRFSWTGSR